MAFLTSRKDQQYTAATEITSAIGTPYVFNSGEGRDYQKAYGHKELLSDVMEIGRGGMALGPDAFMFAESGARSSKNTDLQIKSLDPALNLNSPAYFPNRRFWAFNNPWQDRYPEYDRIGQDIDYANGLFVVGAPNAENGYGSAAMGTYNPKGNVHVYDVLGNALFSKQVDQSGVRSDIETLYGQSVAIGCGIIAVGAPWETDSNYPMNAGSVYLYDYSGNFIKKLKSTITDIDSHSDLIGTSGIPFESFGYSVAIGCDRIVVGAPGITHTHSGVYANTSLCPSAEHSTKAECDNNSTANHHDSGPMGNWHQHWLYLQSGSHVKRRVLGPAVYIYDLDGNLIKRIHATTESGAPDLAMGNVSSYRWIENNNQHSPEFGCSVDVAQGRIIVGARNYMGTSEINTSGGWETRVLPTHDAIGKAYLYDLNGSLIKEIFCPEITPAGKGLYDSPGPRVGTTSDGPDVTWKRTAQYWSDAGGYFHNAGEADHNRAYTGGLYGFQFGRDVSIGSGRIVIGAPGMLGPQEVPSAYRDFAGAAYTFDLDGNFIEKLSYNTATDNLKQGNNNFGTVFNPFPSFSNFGYRVLARKGYIFISQPGVTTYKNNTQYKGIIHVYKTKDIVTAYDVKDWSYGH